MKKKSVFLFLFLCSYIVIYTQNNSDSVFAKNVIKTYPLNYLTGGEINIGYETIIDYNSSFEIIGAYNFKDWIVVPHFSSAKSETKTNYFNFISFLEEGGQPSLVPSKGGSIRLNYRYYFGKKNRPIPLGTFVNTQLMYKHTRFNELFYQCDYHADSINAKKQAVTVKVLLGNQTKIFDKISFSYYFGLGIRYHHVLATSYYSNRYDDEKGELIESWDKKTQRVKTIMPTLHLGISFGYYF